jgi:phytoene/squalene synthetase
LSQFDEKAKREIEAEIDSDFQAALVGIQGLPRDSRLGVYVAYIYYTRLFKKIRALSHERILEARVRIPNAQKATLFVGSYLRHSLNLL